MLPPSSRKRVPRWLGGAALGAVLLVWWGVTQRRQAVVTVRFMPEQDAVLDTLYVIVRGEKQHAAGLRRGQSERFAFQPGPECPLDGPCW